MEASPDGGGYLKSRFPKKDASERYIWGADEA